MSKTNKEEESEVMKLVDTVGKEMTIDEREDKEVDDKEVVVVVVERQLTLETTCTDESSEYLSTASLRAHSLTPFSCNTADESPNYISQLFQTPEQRPIEWKHLGISPGSTKITIKEAEKRIIADGILQQVPEPEDINASTTQCRCILFLYLMEFFWMLPLEQRIKQIKQCLKTENVARLRKVAFSEASDRVSPSCATFQYYFNNESVQRIFFARDNSFGGFPFASFYRLQFSSNCYKVAACTWFSLKRQKDFGKNIPPIDTAHASRHLLIRNDEALIDRVINDKRESAVTFALQLTGTSAKVWQIIQVKFQYDDAETLGLMIYNRFKRCGFGLISEFIVPKHFAEKQKANLEEMGMGYWKFDGVSIDCEGEYVRIGPDKQCSLEEKPLKKQWEMQHKEMENAKKERAEHIRGLFPPAPNQLFRDKGAESDSGNVSECTNRTESMDSESLDTTHAMVLLGGCIEKGGGRDKYYFMLLNSWTGMPLVLVSADYLLACSCTIFFCDEKMSEETANKWGEKCGHVLCTYNIGDDGEHSAYLPQAIDGSH